MGRGRLARGRRAPPSVFELDTLSTAELRAANLPVDHAVVRGGFPELWAQPEQESLQFYEDYLVTYLERDLRALLDVVSLRTFDRFLRALSLRVGSLMNHAELAKDVGVSPNTAKSWLAVLEASGLVHILPPYFGSLTKRLIKTPKVYLRDNGLLCHLLGVHDPTAWRHHAMTGRIFENFVFSELFKQLAVTSTTRALHFWRDRAGREVDFVVEQEGSVMLIESKTSEIAGTKDVHFDRFREAHPGVRAEGLVACLSPDAPRRVGPGLTLVNLLLAPIPLTARGR